MAIEITVRHTEALEDLKEVARNQAETLMDEFRSVEHVHVIMDVEKHKRHSAEVIVQGKNRVRCEAKESSDNMRQSLAAAMDKVTKQLGRLREKIHDHKPAMKHVEAENQRRVEETL